VDVVIGHGISRYLSLASLQTQCGEDHLSMDNGSVSLISRVQPKGNEEIQFVFAALYLQPTLRCAIDNNDSIKSITYVADAYWTCRHHHHLYLARLQAAVKRATPTKQKQLIQSDGKLAPPRVIREGSGELVGLRSECGIIA
jgi:hypothetical protein